MKRPMDRQRVCCQRAGVTHDPKTPAEPKPVEEKSPPAGDATTAAAPNQLTPEQQMEAFAEELKEKDWGHQPC